MSKKTYTLDEVIAGLKEGKSFERDGELGTERVVPYDDNSFTHHGVEKTGPGDCEMTYGDLENIRSRWAEEGWILC